MDYYYYLFVMGYLRKCKLNLPLWLNPEVVSLLVCTEHFLHGKEKSTHRQKQPKKDGLQYFGLHFWLLIKYDYDFCPKFHPVGCIFLRHVIFHHWAVLRLSTSARETRATMPTQRFWFFIRVDMQVIRATI